MPNDNDTISSEPSSRFFKRMDWLTALATFIFSTIVFYNNMAPEVTLQDSGELVTGAFTFGVPHPPGYPLWAFLGYVWSHFVVPFGNPAWRIGLMSVFTGSLTVGILTILMVRSTRVLLHTLPWTKDIEEKLIDRISFSTGAASALLFGFNRGVWLWASVSEMRVLNVFSFILIAFLFFTWMMNPQRIRYLCATLLVYGLSMTNHQTVAVMALALAMGTLALGVEKFFITYDEAPLKVKTKAYTFNTLMGSLSVFWEICIAVLFSLATTYLLFAWLRTGQLNAEVIGSVTYNKLVVDAFKKPLMMLVAGGGMLGVGFYFKWLNPRRALLYMLLFLCGCGLYLYMPFAASTNPPMNWGFASTKDGFIHAVTRGQYEKLSMADPCGKRITIQLWIFIRGLIRQYSWPVCIFGLVSLVLSTVWLITSMAKDLKKNLWLLWVGIGAIPLAVISVAVLRQIFLPLNDPGIIDRYSSWFYILWGLALPMLLCMLIGLWRYLQCPGRSWMVFVWTAFLVCSLGLIIIINPKIDKLEQEITIKFFAPAHGFFAMLIGYGIAVTLAFIGRLRKYIPYKAVSVLCFACFALPYITYKNNKELCSLSTHDFGYQFGYRMFCPGDGYPDMAKDAILFGGTDPGRFVPTYLIFCESAVEPKHRYQSPHLPPNGSEFDRSDVYIITQNALADKTYVNYIRDHYDYSRPDVNNPETLEKFTPLQRHIFKWGWKMLGRDSAYPKEPIQTPSLEDNTKAFAEYIEDVQAGRRAKQGNITSKDGRYQVEGAVAVMEINGILAKNIFDWNKDKHEFYIEESYPIQWMYPYLRPFGVIMKLEKNPLPPPQRDPKLWKEIVDLDTAYWDKLTKEFRAREEFVRNMDAKKAFSKLRASIAGIYLIRGMLAEAEYAYKQSMELCPEFSEGGIQLVRLYISQYRYDEARTILKGYREYDEFHEGLIQMTLTLNDFENNYKRRLELTEKMKTNYTFGDAFELIDCCAKLFMHDEARQLSLKLLDRPNLSENVLFELGSRLSRYQYAEIAQIAFQRYTEKVPMDSKGWVELGWTYFQVNRVQDGYEKWQKAVQLGGDNVRKILVSDERFTPIWSQPNLPKQFQDLVTPTQRNTLLPW